MSKDAAIGSIVQLTTATVASGGYVAPPDSAELVRLRERVERLNEYAASLLVLITCLEQKLAAAERDAARLREALQKIARRTPIMGSTGEYRDGQLHALEACAHIARAATQPGSGGSEGL